MDLRKTIKANSETLKLVREMLRKADSSLEKRRLKITEMNLMAQRIALLEKAYYRARETKISRA